MEQLTVQLSWMEARRPDLCPHSSPERSSVLFSGAGCGVSQTTLSLTCTQGFTVMRVSNIHFHLLRWGIWDRNWVELEEEEATSFLKCHSAFFCLLGWIPWVPTPLSAATDPFASTYCSACRIFILWKWACLHQSVNSVSPDRWEPCVLFQKFPLAGGIPVGCLEQIIPDKKELEIFTLSNPWKQIPGYLQSDRHPSVSSWVKLKRGEWQPCVSDRGSGRHPGVSASMGAEGVLDFSDRKTQSYLVFST